VNDQFKVPTTAFAAEVRYFDERALRGEIFIPSLAQHHSGAMRPEEWLNQNTRFLPFLAEGGTVPTLLNKRYIVVLTVTTPDDHAVVGMARNVIVECGSIRLYGIVHVDMPEHASRLLDWINGPQEFLVLHEGHRRHIIQKNRITFVSEES
jgi:hypothetical protein